MRIPEGRIESGGIRLATFRTKAKRPPDRIAINGRFAWKNRKYQEGVQYENQYTQEISVYALSRRGAPAWNEHSGGSAAAQFVVVWKMAREELRPAGELP